VDPEALEDYLTFQFVLGDRTLFRGIHKLEPGSYQLVGLADGRVQTAGYWAPNYQVDAAITEVDAVERLRALLEDAVRLQLRSDVPVGSHLSGGLDSSIIACLAAPNLSAGMHAFTGVFREGPDFDETPYARAVAKARGLALHEIVPEVGDISTLLPRLVWHLDEPAAGPGVIPQFAVSAFAARHVKVTLGGQGGDEVFGGYTRYLVAYLEQALKGAIYETNEEAEHIVSLRSILPNLPTLQRYAPMLQQFWRSGVFEPMDRRYFRLLDRLGGAVSALSPEWRAAHNPEHSFERFSERFNRPDTQSYFNKMTHFDLTAGLPALLQVEDRASMASGLESRVPLLDHRLVEFMATLLPRLKFRGGELKYLLKKAAQGVVPEAVLGRKDKMGFPVPLHLWTRGASRDFVRDTLLSSRARERGIFDLSGVEGLLRHERDFSRQSWGMLNLEVWFRTFIDR
jgi:asparagine synthase (glutamine-hydrolysing)